MRRPPDALSRLRGLFFFLSDSEDVSERAGGPTPHTRRAHDARGLGQARPLVGLRWTLWVISTPGQQGQKIGTTRPPSFAPSRAFLFFPAALTKTQNRRARAPCFAWLFRS